MRLCFRSVFTQPVSSLKMVGRGSNIVTSLVTPQVLAKAQMWHFHSLSKQIGEQLASLTWYGAP